MEANATNRAGTDAGFDATLEEGGQLNGRIGREDAATSTLHVIAIGLLAGASVAEGSATIEGTTAAQLGSATRIQSPGTNVKVQATHVGQAHAHASGGAGGIVGAAILKAVGTDSPNVDAYLESGAVVGDSAGKPNSLAVGATSTEGTTVNSEAGSGGIVSANGISASSTLKPNVEAYLAGGDTVELANNLTVLALLEHAEGHTDASAYGGGVGQVGAANAVATTEPTVIAYAGSGSKILAGGNVTINAENLSNETGKALKDTYEANSGNVNQSNGSVEFPESGLNTGDAVLYVAGGSGLPGMRQGCELAADGGCIYSVIVNGNRIQFGEQFVTKDVNTSGIPGFCSETEHPTSCPGVDPNRNVIRFATPDNFATGDPVVLEGVGIGAPTNKTLYVRVIDPYTVALYETKAEATAAATTFGAGAVEGSEIKAGNFSPGERVSYESAPALTFNWEGVDVNPNNYETKESGAYDIVVGQVYTKAEGKNHCESSFCHEDGLFTGEEVVYNTTGPSVGGLINGHDYYVIVINPYVIQLAETLDGTQEYTYSCGKSCTETHHRNPIHITRPSEGKGVQEIAPAPIAGLTNGYTYVVDASSTSGVTKLDPVGGGGPIGLSVKQVDHRVGGSEVTITVIGGTQRLFKAGLALVPGSATDTLRIDLSGTLSGTYSLYAPDGTSLRLLYPPTGDGLTTAIAEGGGGGGFSLNLPEAEVKNRATVKAYDDAALIEAGGNVTINSTSSLNDSAHAQNGSGGLIAASNVETHINVGEDNNYAFVGGDIGGNTIKGNTSGIQVSATGVVITAGGNIAITSYSFVKTHNTAESSSGGLGDGSLAKADTAVTENTAAVVGANAKLKGRTVRVDSHSSGEHFGEAEDNVYAFIGFAERSESYTLTSNDTALLDGSPSTTTAVTGIYGVDVRAWHENENPSDNVSGGCYCIGPTLGGAGHNDTLHNTAAGHEGVVVTAGPRLEYGVNEEDPGLETPLKSITADKSLALYVEGQDENNVKDDHPSQHIEWNSDVIVYDGAAPFLRIGPGGEAAEAVNITVNCAIPDPKNPSCITDPGPKVALNGIVADISDSGAGEIQMDSTLNGGGTISGGVCDATGESLGCASGNHHWGTFTFFDNYPEVTIINESLLTLQIDNIDVINTSSQPTVRLNAPTIHFGKTNPEGFAIKQGVTSSLITIRGTTTANILLNGTIENPIGETVITNKGGNILASTTRGATTSDGHTSLITTNILKIDAETESIGAAGGNYVNVDMIQYPGHPLDLRPTAGTDINLDVLTWLRDKSIPEPTLEAPYVVEMDHFVAGRSINVRLQPTLYGAGTKALPGIKVVAQVGPSGNYFNYYWEDKNPAGNFPEGAFSASFKEVPSTYDFTLLDAGSKHPDGSVDVYAANDGVKATRINIESPEVEVRTEAGWNEYGDLSADTNGFITLTEWHGDMRLGVVRSTDDNVTLTAPGSIYDAPVGTPNPPPTGHQPPESNPEVLGVNITLTAETGSIGEDSNFVEIVSSIDRFGVLVAHAPGVIRITQTTGDLHVDEVSTCYGSSATKCANISLTTDKGSITDGHNGGLGGTTPNVTGNTLDLQALGGSIGAANGTNDLKIFAAAGSECTAAYSYQYQGANYQNATGEQRAVTDTCDFAAQADYTIYVTQTQGLLPVLLARAHDGNVRLTTTETGTGENHILLLHNGSTLVVETSPSKSPPSPQPVPYGLIEAENGNVKLVSADNIVTDPSSQILATTKAGGSGALASSAACGPVTPNASDPNQPKNATGNIDICGDSHPGVAGIPGVGTTIVLRGSITPGTEGLTRVFGNEYADTIIFDQTYLGGNTRAYGSATPTAPGGYAPEGDGSGKPCSTTASTCDDTFIVNRLQSMVPLAGDVALGSTLTLDGQSGSNTYDVYTSGSQFTENNYTVNVLGTHAPTDGNDTLNIFGYDSYTGNTPNKTGVNSLSGENYATNDIFLLRSTPYITGETAIRPPLYQGTGHCSEPDGTKLQETSAAICSGGAAFVALLHTSLEGAEGANSNGAILGTGETGTFGVERINYDSAMNGGLHVYSLGGNDYFAVDDNSTSTYLEGGQGNNTFQIGQLYGLQRTNSGNYSGNLAAENIFAVATVATTQGWLSRGTSSPLVAQGGTGNNTFIVYSNQAVVHLEGDGGNNTFIVRGFALAETNSKGEIVLPGGCSAIQAPNCLPIPLTTNGYSTSAETEIRTGAGNNQVEYNMNAPVSVDGGTGFNQLIILGTEFADHIVVTAKGVYGAGVSVSYINIEVLVIDALQGDDTIDVLSTAPGVAVKVIGGEGSNTINVAGDVIGNVYAEDINGSSATINEQIITEEALYKDLTIPGVSLSVVQGSQGAVIITEPAGGMTVAETETGPIGTIAAYNVRLAREPNCGAEPECEVFVRITAEPDLLANRTGTPYGDSILLAVGENAEPGTEEANSAFYEHTIVNGKPVQVPRRTVVLVFNKKDWQTPQVVSVGAINSPLADGKRLYEISSTVISADPFYNGAVVRNVEVTKLDSGTPAIRVTNLGNSNTPGLFSDGVGNGTSTFTSATATFTQSDVGQSIIEIDGGSNIPSGTKILSFINATTVTLSNTVAGGTGIAFSLPSRITPPSQFTDGKANGTTTFESASANFTLNDLGQPLIETDGGGHIPSGDVITAVISQSKVTLSQAVSAASGIAFVLPSRLDGFLSYRDGHSEAKSTEFTSATAAFNNGDIGRPIVETDGRAVFAPGTVILSVKNSTTVILSAPALMSASNDIFALPARNASNVVLQGSATTGIVDYYSMTLATKPAGEVIVDVNPSDARVTLSSSDPRFKTVTAAFGTTAGVYEVVFTPSNWNVPVVIEVSATPQSQPADPHNTWITSVVDAKSNGTAPEYKEVGTEGGPLYIEVLSNREAGAVVQAPENMLVTKCGNNACTTPGPGSSYTIRLTEEPTLPVNVGSTPTGRR